MFESLIKVRRTRKCVVHNSRDGVLIRKGDAEIGVTAVRASGGETIIHITKPIDAVIAINPSKTAYRRKFVVFADESVIVRDLASDEEPSNVARQDPVRDG